MRSIFRKLWKTGLWLGVLIAVGAPVTTLVVMGHDRDLITKAQKCMDDPAASRELAPGHYWLTRDGLRAYVIKKEIGLEVVTIPTAQFGAALEQGYRAATMQEVVADRCKVWISAYEGKTTFYANGTWASGEMYTQEQHPEYFFLSLLGVLPLLAWWGLGKWVGWLAAPSSQSGDSAPPPPRSPPVAAPPPVDTAKGDAMELLGWNGESLSEEAFKRLRKNAMNLWHPDKREAFVASTGKSAAHFDSMSTKVMAALQWLEQNAVVETGNVVGW
jgi:hypothetical protein